jgi:arabinoxylan arabinofuranohydrolase
MRKIVILLILGLSVSQAKAQNPIVPPGIYIADPSAHQWNDGKIYIYGSRDEKPGYFCSWNYHVLSSSDLKTWSIHENSFATKGANDKVPYSDEILYAPDCQYKNGTYYLYYCLATNKNTEGVATSPSPTGPFNNAKNIKVYGYNEIDPCVFIDDDGQAYYIWGQMTAKMAKLKPNMTEIDSSTIKDNVVTEKEHFFHEGGYMVKRKGIYYFVYAHMGRAGRPTCIGYATSKSPMGPFKYGGVIIDNDHCDPGCWNNHGSLAEFNGKWYVFYHRSTHGTNTMRKACVEPITFNDDGSINEVEMTSQGAGNPLKASSLIDAERACLLYGNVRIKAISENNEALTEMRSGDAAGYKYIDFGNGVDSILIRVAPGAKGFTINVNLDDSWGPVIASLNMPENGDGKTMQTLSCKVKNVKGVHALWFRFWGDGDDLAKIDWFTFKSTQNK